MLQFQDPLRGRPDDEGQTMAEYAVVLAVIALGALVALGGISGIIEGRLGNAAGLIGGV